MERAITPPVGVRPVTAGGAYWRQRAALAANRARILDLFDAVECANDLALPQWAQIMAITLEFAPDLIIELGRGTGNSTCVFTEALNQLGPDGRSIVSLCRSEDWGARTADRVAAVVPPAWFAPLDARQGDILSVDYGALVCGAERCLVFWDAHGFDIAECVLGELLPLVAERPHLVLMHDLSDASGGGPEARWYGDLGLWKGNDSRGRRVFLGDIHSAVEQAVAITDFTSRNAVQLHSADASIAAEIGRDAARVAEMRARLGEMWSPAAAWFYFSLNEAARTFTFPRFQWVKVREGRLHV